MENPIVVSEDLRMAGMVKRYHVWPVREQTVAEHSWQICRILLSITTEEISAILIPHAILHDVGEVAVGDIPFPVKRNNPTLDLIFSEIESEAVSALMKRWALPPVIINEWDPQLRWVFKTAEFIEMCEFGMEELIRGNEFGRAIYERCRDIVEQRLEEFTYTEDWEKETLAKTKAYLKIRYALWGKYV